MFSEHLNASAFITNFSREDGLAQTTINDIVEDDLGFLLLATQDGLVRFDGYDFNIMRHQADSPNTLASNRITALEKDSTGLVWIGTFTGLNTYSGLHNKIARIDVNFSQLVTALAISAEGQVWIGTRSGLFTSSAPYQHIEAVKLPGKTDYPISALVLGPYGSLWIGTKQHGLLQYNAITSSIKAYSSKRVDKAACGEKLKNNSIAALELDQNHILWIGYSNEAGYQAFNMTTTCLSSPNKHKLMNDLQDETIKAFLHDRQGRLWVGGYGGGGVIRWNEQAGMVRQWRSSSAGKGLRNDKILSMYEDATGTIWFGTAGGLSKLDPAKERFGHIAYAPNNGGLSERIVTAVFEDNQQRLWIGTFGGGLYHLDDTSQTVTAIRANGQAPGSLRNDFIISLAQAPKGRLWVGTTQGLDLFDPLTNKTLEFQQSGIFTGEMILDARQDAQQHIWFKGDQQLHIYNPGSASFCLFPKELAEVDHLLPVNQHMWLFPKQLARGILQVKFWGEQCHAWTVEKINIPGLKKFEPLLQDSQGHIWVSTTKGLAKISADFLQVEHFTLAEGLPSTTVYGALEDNQGHLWVSTNGGLAKLAQHSQTFISYQQEDGLQSNEFIGEGSVKRANGQLVFAGINGLNVFDPLSIKPNPIPPKVYITAVTLLESIESPAEVRVSGSGQPISNGAHLSLSGQQYGFEMEFTALHFLEPKANRFRFRLQGFDESWTEVGSDRRFARYTNLSPGQYQFQVNASNAHGIWSKQHAQVAITVLTPWWMTLFAKFVYAIVLSALLYAIFRWRVLELHRKNRLLENQVFARTEDIRQQKETIEQQMLELQALDLAKERFFENISHEFRTPLSLIIGPLQRLYQRNDFQGFANKLEIPIRQASRLLRLINQLLEISRLGSGTLRLNYRSYRLSEQIRLIAGSFVDAIEHKNLKLSLSLDDDIRLSYDASAMEKILVNLLSNAINYNHAGGQIAIKIRANDNNDIILSVHDTGIGIAKAQQADIFQRFNMAQHQGDFQQGLGVGLALVKELVLLHKGKISLTSRQGEGSCFTIEFPQNTDGGEITEVEALHEVSPARLEQAMMFRDRPLALGKQVSSTASTNITTTLSQQWTILLVEDELDMRTYCRELLQDYHLLLAENGQQGLDLAIEQVPDLIITDVMMPIMDGLQLSAALRQQRATSHIPIIMLTAKGGRDSKLAGLREGVDDYIVKPFDDEEFCLRVKNILVIRDELAKNFNDAETSYVAKLPLPVNEQKFIMDFRAILQQGYSNAEFSLTEMAQGMILEKRQLQRKLKALLNTSPTEYLRSFRLQKAAQMILQGESVSQTFERSGFSAISHFSRCFRARFGVAPSQYRRLQIIDGRLLSNERLLSHPIKPLSLPY